MKKLFAFLLLFITLVFNIRSQENSNKDYALLKAKDAIVFVDNTENAYFSIEFPGDSVLSTDVQNAFIIDKTFYQIIKNGFKPQQYNNNQDSTKEIELLKSYEDYEVDYLEKEVFKQIIETKSEIFKNQEGKRFYLWYYKMPEIDSLNKENEYPATWHIYLAFVSNSYVAGIYAPVTSNEVFEEKLENLKKIAENIDVFGYRVDVDALSVKIDADKIEKKMEFNDSTKHLSIEIPEWLNIVEADNSKYFAATFPDIDNIINAVIVSWYKKSDYNLN